VEDFLDFGDRFASFLPVAVVYFVTFSWRFFYRRLLFGTDHIVLSCCLVRVISCLLDFIPLLMFLSLF
jgi:hypothetical protein